MTTNASSERSFTGDDRVNSNLWVKFASFFMVLAMSNLLRSEPSGGGRLPIWNAAEVVRRADLIAVVENPARQGVAGAFPGVSAPEVFGREDAARIHVYRVLDVIKGDTEAGKEIVFVQPPGFEIHRSARLSYGTGLLFLRRMPDRDIRVLREKLPERWASHFPDDVWTFAEQEFQWMSMIQFTTRRDADTNRRLSLRGPLVAQLRSHAGVARDEKEILAYIRNLVEIRGRTLNGETPVKELDLFQRDVVNAERTAPPK